MNVRLTAYTAQWAVAFECERVALMDMLAPHLMAVEHFGSTAVPGLVAKPVIDILAVVHDLGPFDEHPLGLAALGYEAAGPRGIPRRRLFLKGGSARSHHLHVYQWSDPDIARHLALRDYLRCVASERDAYGTFKAGLAHAYRDTHKYSPAKKPYVAALEARALEWARQGAWRPPVPL